jgi:hypothetical protein
MTKKITELDPALPLTGAEIVPLVQNVVTRRSPLSALADWVLGTYPGYLPAGAGAVPTSAQGKMRSVIATQDYSTPEAARVAATASAPAGFWDDDPTPGRLFRMGRRVFVDDAATEGAGTKAGGSQKSWVGYSANGYMTYFETRGSFASFSSIGGIGIAGASRTSDGLPEELNTIGGAFFAKNDNTNPALAKSAWAIYGHAAHEQSNFFTTAIELDVCSLQPAVEVNPYLTGANGTTATAWFGVGGETAQGLQANGQGALLQNVSCCIGIINSESAAAGNRYAKGIVFGANAIAGTDGITGLGIAMEMAKGHVIQWKTGAYLGAAIRSDVNAANAHQQIVFANHETQLISNGGLTLRVEDASFGSPVNHIRAIAFGVGGNPHLIADGADTDIDLVLRGKGGGGVVLSAGSTAQQIRINTTGIGFFGATPVSKPTITGSRGGNAALSDLLAALADMGLINNGTTG